MMKNAKRWKRNRGEYLREVGWFLGISPSKKKRKENSIIDLV
jgi:hypothetical protein